MTEGPESSSFDDVFRLEFPAVVRAAHLIVGDPEAARDIAQDAFTKLFVHWKKVSQFDRPGAWVRRVAINAAINSATRGERRRQVADRVERERIRPTETETDNRTDALLSAVGELSPQQRAAVALFYFEDRSIAEIASLMAASEATVKVHLHRARQRLGQTLNKEVADGTG